MESEYLPLMFLFAFLVACQEDKNNNGRLDYLPFVGDKNLYGKWRFPTNDEIALKFKKNTVQFLDQTFIYQTKDDTLFLKYGQRCGGSIKLLYETVDQDTLRIIDTAPYFVSKSYYQDSLGGALLEYVRKNHNIPEFREPPTYFSPRLKERM